MPAESIVNTLIIGAGPAGLTAAYQLSKQGVRSIVIEADTHYVGGISRTVDYKGFLFDIGGHRFFSKSPEVVALWHEILPDDFIERPQSEAKEKEKAALSARITFPQWVTMGAAIVTATAIVMGGLMWMINQVAGTVRSDMLAQQAQIGLQVRGMTDGITAAQTAIQILQRDISGDRVKLGLVEQSAANSARFLPSMEGYDAGLARHDEQIKALQQANRESAARQPRP